jgi:hypothetical protein
MGSFNDVTIPIAAVSSACMAILIAILRKVRWNGFIVLIFCLAVCTLVRCSSYFFKLIPSCGEGLYLIIDMISDIQSGIWTNFISLTLLRMVYTLKTVNIVAEMPYYLVINFIIPFSVGIYSLAAFGLTSDRFRVSFRIFYWIRFAIITVNVCCYVVSIYLALRLSVQVKANKLTQSQADAICMLVFRMQSFAVAQVVTRAGSMWQQWNRDSYDYPPAEWLASLTSPACGIAYFIVFLYIQPTVRMKIVELFHENWNYLTNNRCPCTCCLQTEPKEDLDSSGRETKVWRQSQFINNSDLLEMIANEDDDDLFSASSREASKERALSSRGLSAFRKSQLELT